MSTLTLTTDKNGNVYDGPQTFAQAELAISNGASAVDVEAVVRDAGYIRIADRIRREYAGQMV